jgi:hypothetical protein
MEISILDAFTSMFKFLVNYYYQLNKPDDLGLLLSELQLLEDNQPGDPAAWFDWIEAINKVSDSPEKGITVFKAYQAMYEFLKEYYSQLGNPEQIGFVVSELQESIESKVPQKTTLWLQWKRIIEDIGN